MLVVVLAQACGGKTETIESTGGSGASGGSGSGGGGSSGTSAGGRAGGGAQAGTAGGSATGGTGPQGGIGGGVSSGGSGGVSEPECMSDENCVLINNCCDCLAGPATDPYPNCIELPCPTLACDRRSIPATAARCRAGRCVFDVDCDATRVTCLAAPPACPPGEVPAVRDGCWAGGCVAASECASVTNCAVCGPDLGCVVVSTIGGTTYHCATPASGCTADRSCECFGLSVCSPLMCGERSEGDGVGCYCPSC